MEWQETQPSPFCASGVVELIFDRLLETAVEEDSMVVASRAPFAALCAAQFLHVENGGFIHRIVERRHVVHGAVPLLVDVLVALAAQLGIHEEVGRDQAAGVSLRGGWPEGRFRSGAFLGHRDRDHLGVANTVRRLVGAQSGGHECQAQDGGAGARQQDHQSQNGETDMDPQRGEVIMSGANDGQVGTGQRRDQQRDRAAVASPLPNQPRGRSGSQHQMQQNVADIEESWGRKRRDIRGVQQRNE